MAGITTTVATRAGSLTERSTPATRAAARPAVRPSPLAIAIPLASLLVCNFADVATTGRLLSMGGREMNPVAGWLIANHWLLLGKIAMVAIIGCLVAAAPPKRWIVPGLWVAAAFYALIIAFHMAELGLA